MLPSYQPDDLLKEEEAAHVLRVSVRTMQTWRRRKSGPAYVRVGRLIRYRWSAILEFMNNNTH
jgi:predicted DNA-binding transcriptional regulator AlpA